MVKRAQTAIEQKFENDFFQSVQNALEKKKENNKNLTQRASEGINITKKKTVIWKSRHQHWHRHRHCKILFFSSGIFFGKIEYLYQLHLSILRCA